MSVMRDTYPDTYGVFYMTVNRWRVREPSPHRHGYRHRRKGLGKLLPRYHDGDDAHDDELRAYSRQGAHLHFVGHHPFKLTRRTRRAEQGVPYLCGFSAYAWCRVRLISLMTRRRYPTTDHPCRRVRTEHRRVSNWNPTTTSPLLMPDTTAIVGFVGFVRRNERALHGGEREEGDRER